MAFERPATGPRVPTLVAILLASLLAFSFYTGHAIITQPASSATRQPVRAGGDGGGDIVKGLFNEFKQYMEDASEAALWKASTGPAVVVLRDVEKASNANNEGTTRSWVKPLDFIQSCDDFVGPLPADHPSLLAPVFAGRQEAAPINASLILQTWDAAANLRALSMQPGFSAAPATPCTRADLVDPQPVPAAKPKIAILMTCDFETEMSRKSLADKEDYAKRHGYTVHVMSGLPHSPVKDERKERPGMGKFWDRIPAVMTILHLYDWVWMLDLDTIIMAPTIPLERFLDPRSDVIVGADCNGPNSGSTIYRNSTCTAMYLSEAYTRTPDETPNYDNWQENAVAHRLSQDYLIRNHFKVVPTKDFNAYSFGDCGNIWQPGDFLIHFPGISDKVERFMEYFPRRDPPLPNA